MKKLSKLNVWGAIASLIVVFLFFSCKPGDTPGDPDDPNEPTTLVKPDVKICTAENVTDKAAVLVAWITSHELATKVSFEYKTSTETKWQSITVSGTYSDKDSVKVILDLYDLTPNSEYSFRVKAANKAGENVSSEIKFSTYVVKDYDGNLYHIIKIGDQYWLQENLKATHYSDGTVIPNVTDGEVWANLTTGACCWYDNDEISNKVYGALYNWYITTSSKKFITGYHIPSDQDFQKLIDYTNGDAKKLVDNSGKYWPNDWANWQDTNPANANSTGFTALGSGKRCVNNGNSIFFGKNYENSFWTTSYNSSSDSNKISVISPSGAEVIETSYIKEWGFSIRLIKD